MLFESRSDLQSGTPYKSNLFNLQERVRGSTMLSLDDELTLLKLTFSDVGRAVFRWDFQGRQLQWSNNVTDMFPFLRGKNFDSEAGWVSLIHPDDRPLFIELKDSIAKQSGSFMVEYRLAPGNGMLYPVRHLGSVSGANEGHPYAIGILQMAEQPTTSPTPSLNQTAHFKTRSVYPPHFTQKVDDAITRCTQYSKSGALLVISLTNLGMIINSVGHHNSEALIQNLIDTIRVGLQEHDSIERIGRDQLGVILADVEPARTEILAMRLREQIHNYGINAPVGSLHITCSLVSVDFPHTAKNGIDALDKAYIALSSKYDMPYRTFEDIKGDLIQSRQNMGLANYLRRAIAEKRLLLAYQPIIDSASGEVAHYEALLRVIGDDGKINSAGPLIPVAECMGMIDEIDTLVFDMVLDVLEKTPNIEVAFNVSNMTTDDPRWLAHFTKHMKDKPEIASRMIVEITETAAQRDLRQTAYFVAALQSAGCQVALDDFGSGHTSFRQLKALSVDMVKIDGAFVKDLVDNMENRFFIKTLLGFTSGLGLKAVAEFVENGETAKLLMELGVEYLQGYYFGKPETGRPWEK